LTQHVLPLKPLRFAYSFVSEVLKRQTVNDRAFSTWLRLLDEK